MTDSRARSHKVAVPVSDGCLAEHFGHCERFAVYEVDRAAGEVLGSESHVPPPHEPGALPRWLHGLGADVIIAGGMGRRAQTLFAENGIDVVVGAPSEPPDDVVAAYAAGTLEAGENACDH